jgi:hypothetical protein
MSSIVAIGSITSCFLTTTITDFLMMFSTSIPPPAGFYDVFPLDPEFNQMAEEQARALMEAMDFEDKLTPSLELPLPQPQEFSPSQVFNEAPFLSPTPTGV